MNHKKEKYTYAEYENNILDKIFIPHINQLKYSFNEKGALSCIKCDISYVLYEHRFELIFFFDLKNNPLITFKLLTNRGSSDERLRFFELILPDFFTAFGTMNEENKEMKIEKDCIFPLVKSFIKDCGFLETRICHDNIHIVFLNMLILFYEKIPSDALRIRNESLDKEKIKYVIDLIKIN